MAKQIRDCKGARVYSALVKKDGKNIVTHTVHYKNESKWCNNWDEVLIALKQIAEVQLLGDEYKTWKISEGGWRLNAEEKDDE